MHARYCAEVVVVICVWRGEASHQTIKKIPKKNTKKKQCYSVSSKTKKNCKKRIAKKELQ
jgi:hypothetical protein